MAVPPRRRLDGRAAAPPRRRAAAADADRRRAGAGRDRPAGGRPRAVRRPRARRTAAARAGIARMRFATSVDDDLRPFYDRFRDDPVIGRAVRSNPGLRVRRQPRAVGDAAGRDHRAADRAPAGDGDPAPPDPRLRLPLPGHRPARRAHARRDRRARRPPSSWRSTSRPSARWPCAAAPRRWRPGGSTCATTTCGGCARSARSARGRARWSPSTARAATTSCPAGDLGFLKIVGRLITGNPKARADEAEVRGFFEPYGEWKGLAGVHLMHAAARGLIRAPMSRGPAPRRAGTRWSAAPARRLAA